MTRLQSRRSSCECGKTTKETESFVTKVSKIYETRSGGRRKRGKSFEENGKDIDLNTLKLRGKIFLKRMENSVVRIPVRTNKNLSLNGNSKVKLTKTSTNASCDRNMPTDTACEFIGNALDNILSSKLKVDIIETNCIRSNGNFEEFSVSNNFISKEIVTDIEDVETKQQLHNTLQNGVYSPLECSVNITDQFKINTVISKAETQVEETWTDEEDKAIVKESELIKENLRQNHGLVEEDQEEVYDSEENSDVKTNINCKKRRKRKSKFQVFLESFGEFKTASSDKRNRKAPKIFSPVINHSRRRIVEIPCIEKSIYTLSGRLRKKCGRRPKPKGPIVHYLDLYVQNKEVKLGEHVEDNDSNKLATPMDCNDSLKHIESSEKIVKGGDCNLESALKPDQVFNEIQNCSPERIPSQSMLEQSCIANSCENSRTRGLPSQSILEQSCIANSCENLKTRKRTKLKKLKRGRQKKINLSSECVDKDIVSILGSRFNNGKSELLVLFENGTSNWIIQDKKDSSLISNFKTFLEHSEQDLSVMNRLGYQLLIEDQRKQDEGTDTEISSDSESDYHSTEIFTPVAKKQEIFTPAVTCDVKMPGCNEVIMPDCNEVMSKNSADDTETKSPTLQLTTLYQLEENDVFSVYDLNELCSYVMSSRHIKLFPYEMTKEIVSKKDEEFLHIYLKRLHRRYPDSNRKTEENLNLCSCEKLIAILEDCAVDSECKVVVISGIEDYFALNHVFDKLLKEPAVAEGKNYEKDVSLLRYLIQTIRNFNKPIAAVIKKSAIGLPASMLSLFDMVFDECGGELEIKTQHKARNNSKTRRINPPRTPVKNLSNSDFEDSENLVSSENCQNYLFPRLMGLTDSNEAQIMGERRRPCINSIDDILSNSSYNGKTLSHQLRKSVRHMKNNSKIQLKFRGRSQSFNSEEDLDNVFESETNPSSLSRQSSCENRTGIELLEKEIKLEKELTQKCMADLATYIKSMEDKS